MNCETENICLDCEEVFDLEDMVMEEDDYYCKECFSLRHTIPCYDCGEEIPENEIILEDDKGYCEECLKSKN